MEDQREGQDRGVQLHGGRGPLQRAGTPSGGRPGLADVPPVSGANRRVHGDDARGLQRRLDGYPVDGEYGAGVVRLTRRRLQRRARQAARVHRELHRHVRGLRRRDGRTGVVVQGRSEHQLVARGRGEHRVFRCVRRLPLRPQRDHRRIVLPVPHRRGDLVVAARGRPRRERAGGVHRRQRHHRRR